MIINKEFTKSLEEAYAGKNFGDVNKLLMSVPLKDLEASAFESVKNNNVLELNILLQSGAYNCSPSLSKLVFKYGVNPDTHDMSGVSLLSYASKHGFLDVMDVLIDCGADIYGKEVSNPVKVASVEDDAEWLSDFDDELPDSYKDSKVLGNDDVDSVKRVVQIRSDRDSPFMAAVNHGNIAAVNKLISAQNKISDKPSLVNIAEDSFGSTPLMLASRRGDEAMVGLLVDHGAVVDVQRSDGMNAIMLAAMGANGNYVEVVKCLLALSPNLSLKNNENKDVFDLVDNEKNPKVYDLLVNTKEYKNKFSFFSKLKKIVGVMKVGLGVSDDGNEHKSGLSNKKM